VHYVDELKQRLFGNLARNAEQTAIDSAITSGVIGLNLKSLNLAKSGHFGIWV